MRPNLTQWMSRHLVSLVAVLAVLVVGSVGLTVWASQSSDGPTQVTWQPSQTAADPSIIPTASTSAEPSASPSTVVTSAAPLQSSGPSNGAGQPPPPGGSGSKPRITNFSYTANGLIVTATFTVQAQADRGPFTCNVRRASIGEENFSCGIGPVSRTWDYDFCCGSEIYIIVTDKHDVRSDQHSDSIELTRPEPPTHTLASYWYDGGTVHVQFLIGSAPGDDTRCSIRISPVQGSSPGYDSGGNGPCAGSTTVSFPGGPGIYSATIRVLSDTWYNGEPGSYVFTVK